VLQSRTAWRCWARNSYCERSMKLPASLLLDVMLDKRQAGSRHQCEGVVLSEDGMETSDHGQGHESGSVDLL
jgi:hypothetical protein